MAKNRRAFINGLLSIGGIGALGSIFYPVLSFLMPPESREAKVDSVNAGSINEIEPNSAKIVKFGREPVILIRKDNYKFSAFGATCTHLDCIVQYNQNKKQIICACHNGVYDLLGRNVSGPPPKPLQVYDVRIVENEVVITNPKG